MIKFEITVFAPGNVLERLHYLQLYNNCVQIVLSTDFEGMMHFYLICMIRLVNMVQKTQSMCAAWQHYKQGPSVLSCLLQSYSVIFI